MKLNKKTEQLIKLRAAELKKLYETPNPEVDKIISELRAEATKRPQNMRKEEEIAYILKKADENCDHIEIPIKIKLLNLFLPIPKYFHQRNILCRTINHYLDH